MRGGGLGQVRTLIRPIFNTRPELKHLDGSVDEVRPDTSWNSNEKDLTLAITQGPAVHQRVGNSVVVWKVEIYIEAAVSATTDLVREMFRMVVWRQRYLSANAASWSALYDLNLTTPKQCRSGLRPPRNDTARILYDKPFMLAKNGFPCQPWESTRFMRKIQLKFKRGLRVQYPEDPLDDSLPGNPYSNQLSVNFIGEQDHGTAGDKRPSANWRWRIYFTDA